MRGPIPSLTGLRFVAALCVVISHAIAIIIAAPPGAKPSEVIVLLSSLSAAGMTLFFVLSGFVIYYNYSEKVCSGAGLYNFFVARFARLYPLYFVGVSWDLLFELLIRPKYGGHYLGEKSLAALPYYATLTQSWFYRPIGEHALIYQFGWISSVAWSVSTEWFFYLVFPLACVGIQLLPTLRARLWTGLILVIIALGASSFLVASAAAITSYGLKAYGPVGVDIQDSFYRWLIYFSPYARISEFLLGCLCASIFVKLETRPYSVEERLGAWLTAATLVAIAALHWLMFGLESEAPLVGIIRGLHMNFGFAPLVAVLIFCCSRYRSPLAQFMSAPAMVLCGEASYSLYLLHLPVAFAFIHALGYRAPIIASDRVDLTAVILVVVVIASAIGLAFVSWLTVERPARKFLRRRMTLGAADAEIAGIVGATRGAGR
jgi:peptidoglycan/LPS O-acetylase OafA/YrhL